MNNISYGRQYISQTDIDAVVETLQSDFLTQGPKVLEFENNFAEYVGAKYALAVSNGTAALHLSTMALGVEKGDKVITTPLTFVASANSVLYCGGEVDFVDIDPETYLMDLDKLEDKLSKAAPNTYKGIIPVDFAGYPIHVERFRKIADEYNLWIIEDACHAPGAKYTDSEGDVQKTGNGTYSDIQVFSFHPVKHIATGEGGMITTNSKVLFDKLSLLRTHGITKDVDKLEVNHGGWYYEMQELGYNYRLCDIQAALGVSQLSRADKGVVKRNAIADKYNKAFKDLKVKTPFVDEHSYHAYHLYIVQVEDRKGFYEHLRANNVFAQVLYSPVHLQPYYKQFGWKKGDMPVAEKYYEHCLALPMFPTLSEEEQDYVIEKIKEFYRK